MAHRNSDEHVATLETLAEMAGTSPRTLQRYLKNAGTSFRDEANASRYRRAKRLLLQSDEPIKQIAMKLGYSRSTHFVNFFKNIAGSTPQRFRKHYRNGLGSGG